jgi:hypothetical protein
MCPISGYANAVPACQVEALKSVFICLEHTSAGGSLVQQVCCLVTTLFTSLMDLHRPANKQAR